MIISLAFVTFCQLNWDLINMISHGCLSLARNSDACSHRECHCRDGSGLRIDAPFDTDEDVRIPGGVGGNRMESSK